MYRVVVQTAVLISSLWCNTVRSSTSSAKSCYGPDYTEPFPFVGVPDDVCIHAYYNSSQTKSLKISLTYGDVVFGTETISDQDPAYDEKTICDPTFPSPISTVQTCNLCLGFDDIFLSDEWAKICPKFILSCGTPDIFKQSYPMKCFSVGNDDGDDINQIVGGNTDFTFNLLSSNALTEDIVTDLFVSPFSISNALIMTMMAANGETLKQIMNAFELTTEDYAIYDSYDTLIQSLQHKTPNLISTIDNRVWINSVWYKVISPAYLRDFDRFGEIISCNFKNQSYVETMKIDNYAETATNNLIQHPLANKNLSSSTVMLFTNVMYLKANWQTPFVEQVAEAFTDDDGEEVIVEMMVTKPAHFNKYNDSEVEVIELPFDDEFSEISFIMIRPSPQKYANDGPTSTIEFEKSLNKSLLKKWLNGLSESPDKQYVALPHLKMFNTEDITDSLRKLGISDLFDPSKCDMKNLTVPHYQVYETNLNRQDYLQISENGVEIGGFVTDGDDGKDPTNQGPVKHADVPFLFLIMDRSVDLVLYAGRVTNPKGWIIYVPPSDDGKSHSKFGIVVLSLFIVATVSYCLIKYAYNRTVMQLSGIEAVPHIQQMRACNQFCNEKINTIYQTDRSNAAMSPPERYAQLMNEDNQL